VCETLQELLIGGVKSGGESVGVDDGLHTRLTDAGEENLVLGIQAEPIGGGKVCDEPLRIGGIHEGFVIRGDLDPALCELHGEFIFAVIVKKGELRVCRGCSVENNDALAFDEEVRGTVLHGDF